MTSVTSLSCFTGSSSNCPSECVCLTVCLCPVDVVLAGRSESLVEAYERRLSVYQSSSCCDYCLRVVIRCWSEQVKQDMQVLVNDKGQSDAHTDTHSQTFTHIKLQKENCRVYCVFTSVSFQFIITFAIAYRAAKVLCRSAFVTLCVCVRRISLDGEGNALSSSLSLIL